MHSDALLADFAPLEIAELPPPAGGRDVPGLSSAPYLIEFGDPALLDPARAAKSVDDASPAPAPTTAARFARRAPLGSLAIHALALLAFVNWESRPTELPTPIPVELVFERPPAPPEPKPEPKPPAPPAHLASEDLGEVTAAAPQPRPVPEAPKPSPGETDTKKGTATPPPSPSPPADHPPADERLAARVLPKPTREAPPAAKPASAAPAPRHPSTTPQGAPRSARFLGPAATRDEYLAYILSLTERHLDLLPLSTVGNRRGETTLSVRVLGDGTIARIAVSASSGYPDIDQRVEQMVIAVGRFPPLPQWIQMPQVELQLKLRFPEALER